MRSTLNEKDADLTRLKKDLTSTEKRPTTSTHPRNKAYEKLKKDLISSEKRPRERPTTSTHPRNKAYEKPGGDNLHTKQPSRGCKFLLEPCVPACLYIHTYMSIRIFSWRWSARQTARLRLYVYTYIRICVYVYEYSECLGEPRVFAGRCVCARARACDTRV